MRSPHLYSVVLQENQCFMKCSNSSFRVVLKCELGLLVNSGLEPRTRWVDILMVISLLYVHVPRPVMEGKHLISLSSEALKYVFSTGTIMSLDIKVPLWESLVGNSTGSTKFFQESQLLFYVLLKVLSSLQDIGYNIQDIPTTVSPPPHSPHPFFPDWK